MKHFLTIGLIAIALCSCSKEEGIMLKQRSYTLYTDFTTKIEATGLPNDAAWISENEFVATANGYTISSSKVGSANLRYEDVSISVTVDPRCTLYTEPDMSWGSSISSIKSKYGNPYSSNNDILIYRTNNSASPLALYSFDNGKLTSSAIVVPIDYVDKLADFLGERYVIYSVDTTKYTADFAHCYGEIKNPKIDYIGRMAFEYSIGGILILYVPNSDDTRADNNSDYFNNMIKALKLIE